MLDRLKAPGLIGQPRLMALGRQQLEDALLFYEGVLRGHGGTGPIDDEARVDEADMRLAAAWVLDQLDRRGDAERQLRLALDEARKLTAGSPQAQRAAKLDMMGSVRLGPILADAGRLDEAIAVVSRALRNAEAIVREAAGAILPRDDVAWCRHNLGDILLRAGRPAEAEPHYRLAVDIRRRLLAERPGNPALKGSLAEDLVNLGLIDSGAGRMAQAEAAYREADALMPPWSEVGIDVNLSVLSRAVLDVDLGALLIATGRPKRPARGSTRRSLTFDGVLDAEPARHEFRDASLKLHGVRAQALAAAGRHADSSRDWDRVVALAPEDQRRKYRMHRALEAVKSGDHAAADEADRSAPAHGDPGEADDSYNLACVLRWPRPRSGATVAYLRPSDRSGRPGMPRAPWTGSCGPATPASSATAPMSNSPVAIPISPRSPIAPNSVGSSAHPPEARERIGWRVSAKIEGSPVSFRGDRAGLRGLLVGSG